MAMICNYTHYKSSSLKINILIFIFDSEIVDLNKFFFNTPVMLLYFIIIFTVTIMLQHHVIMRKKPYKSCLPTF